MAALYACKKIRESGTSPSVTLSDNTLGNPSSTAALAAQTAVKQTHTATANESQVRMTFVGDVQTGESPFSVRNMFPGDRIQQTYRIRFTHESALKVWLSFVAAEGNSDVLADHLTLNVVLRETGDVLLSKSFRAFQEEPLCFYIDRSDATQSILDFDLEVVLPTSAGNDCAYQKIAGDLVWEAQDVDTVVPDGHPVITPPQTGESESLAVYVLLAAGSVILLLFVLILRKRQGVWYEH